MGFKNRKTTRNNPQNPGKLTFDWRTYDNCWRYSVRGDDQLMKNLFPGLKARYGDARNLKCIVLEPALYQITGRNKQGSHRISSNLCRPGIMDRLTIYRRAIKADDWEILGKGYWSDLKDEVTGARNGGQWAHTVAIYLLQADFAPYDPDKEESGPYKTVKIGQIAYLNMRGFSSKFGWDKSATACNLDPKNCAGVVASNTESFLVEPEKKSDKAKYYPSFQFLQFEEVPGEGLGEQLREIGNKAFDTLDTFLQAHFDYYSSEEEEEDDEKGDDGEAEEIEVQEASEDDFEKFAEEHPELAEKMRTLMRAKGIPVKGDEPEKKKGRRKTKTEQAVERRKAELKGEGAVEKITEEEPEEAGLPEDLPF